LHAAKGVQFHLGQPIDAIEVTVDGVALTTAAGTEVVDDLVVCIGIEPNVDVAVRSGLVVGNGVEVDAECRTSVPVVFAAGDVASHDHPRYGRVRVEHVDVAQQQAAAIGKTIAGKPATFADPHWCWTDQYDTNVQGLGLAGIRSGDEMVSRGDLSALDGTVFWLREGLVVAAATVERGEDVSVARELIDLRIPVRPEQLADEGVELDELLDAEEVNA
jgi:3-phenylpropionate/trans-cinnamate dioxygenase ferredoxin reductase subunit